jgi:signal transduction histidine kinase
VSEALRHPPLDTDAGALALVPGLLLFTPLAFLGNEVGALLRFPDVGAAVLFPPYAILTAALVATRRRDWVWYILVGALLHGVASWPHWPLSWVLVADLANIVRALVAALLLRWLFRGFPHLEGIPSLSLFLLSAVLIAPAVGATIGAANVVLHRTSQSYWQTWTAWYLSNALTGLTMLPLLLGVIGSWRAWRRDRIDPRRAVEALLLAGALIGTSTFAFLLPSAARWSSVLSFYAPLPVLIWTAARFGPTAASLALTTVTVAAIWGADRGTGSLLSLSPDEDVLVLQVFVLLTTVPVLCLAAVASARDAAVRLYRALLLSLQDHVAILDAAGIVLEVNDSWRRFAAGGDAHAWERLGAGDDYLEASRAAAAMGDATAPRVLAGLESVLGGVRRRYELEYDRDHDGRREWYTMSAEALEHPAGGAVVTRANVTARRQALMEIEEQRRELSHLARVAALGQLSGALAHELSQPLTSILSNAQAAGHLVSRGALDSDELGAILQDIIAQNRRAGQVIDHLRALLKRGEAHLQPVETGELVREVLELAHAELIFRGIRATTIAEPDLPSVMGDRVQLQQVLLNLIINACEAMAGAARTDRIIALTVGSTADHSVQFSVRDGGTGIPDGIIGRLFEPFVTTKPEGLGLGLSISRTIIAAHGGRLWAENNGDRGATVHCLLPAAKREAPVTNVPDLAAGGGMGGGVAAETPLAM